MGWGGGGGEDKGDGPHFKDGELSRSDKNNTDPFFFCELALYEKPEDRRIPDASQAANVQCRGLCLCRLANYKGTQAKTT